MTLYRTDRTEPTKKLLQGKLNAPYRPEINLHASYHCHTRRVDNSESTSTSNPPGTTDAVFTKLPRPLAKDPKNTSELATYLATFIVTY